MLRKQQNYITFTKYNFGKELMGLIRPGYHCTCQKNTHFVPASLIFICNLHITFHIDHPLGLQVLMTPYGFHKLPKQLKFPPMPSSACRLIAATCFPWALGSTVNLLTSTRTLAAKCIFPAHYSNVTQCFHLPAPLFLQQQPETPYLHLPGPDRLFPTNL